MPAARAVGLVDNCLMVERVCLEKVKGVAAPQQKVRRNRSPLQFASVDRLDRVW